MTRSKYRPTGRTFPQPREGKIWTPCKGLNQPWWLYDDLGKREGPKKKLSNNLNSRGKNSNARNLLSQAERGIRSAAATAMVATNNGGRWVAGAIPFHLNTPNQQVI